jgi:hypothetical protein
MLKKLFLFVRRNFKVHPSTRRNVKRPFDAALTVPRHPSRIFNFKRIVIMKTSYTATIVLALATLAAGQSMAADMSASTNRAPMRSGGDVIEPATGQKLSELFPAVYSNSPVASGKTRVQVSAEMAQAQQAGSSGDVIEPATGQKLSTLFPAKYAAKSAN